MKNLLFALILSTLSITSFAQSNAGSRNASASCDSTCMAQATAVSQESNLQQRVIPCVSGFSGTRLQTRVRQPDGNWGAWIDKDISQCNCAPTSQTENKVCEEPLTGTYTRKSEWTCTSPKSGVWSEWTVETNNCYTPCTALPKETKNESCPSGYSGSGRVLERTSSCSADESKPATWSNWTTVQDNCTKDAAPSCMASETGIGHTCMGAVWGATHLYDRTGKVCYGNGSSGTEYINIGSCGNGQTQYELRYYSCTCN